MSAPIAALLLLASCMCIVSGIARLGTWLIQLREQHASRAIREAAAIAQARAEFLPTPSRLRHLEIEASKSGDLVGAARYAELAEAPRG